MHKFLKNTTFSQDKTGGWVGRLGNAWEEVDGMENPKNQMVV